MCVLAMLRKEENEQFGAMGCVAVIPMVLFFGLGVLLLKQNSA